MVYYDSLAEGKDDLTKSQERAFQLPGLPIPGGQGGTIGPGGGFGGPIGGPGGGFGPGGPGIGGPGGGFGPGGPGQTMPFPPFQPGMMPPMQPGGIPPQLSPANITGILNQHQRPGGQPPGEMVMLFNMLRSNPNMLQSIIQQRPQSLQQAVQFAQFGSGTPRYSDHRILPGFCYNRWSLAFTFNNVFLFFPVTNLFGFVIAYCYPSLTPCVVPNFQILFALC